MLQLNLDGALLKRSATNHEIYACLEAVSGGKTYFAHKVHEFVQSRRPSPHFVCINFTYREMQVLRLLSQGQSSKLIAEHLGLKPATIEDYRKRMLKKTNSKSTAGLVALAMRNGLL